jgi:predicted nucleic acid-binding protein
MPDILTNTSPLIALENIGRLNVLEALYGVVHCTEEVAAEFGPQVPTWLHVHRVQDRTRVAIIGNLVDHGEASLLALAFEMPDSILILDDRKARRLATNLQLRLTGLLGVLIRAQQRGVISSLADELTSLKAVGFRFSSAMEAEAMRLATAER